MTHHLAYEKSEAESAGSTSQYNGTFDPVLIAKASAATQSLMTRSSRGARHQRAGDSVLLLERYGIEVSPDFVGTVTDAVIDEVREWQQRSLEPLYSVVFFDAPRV